MKAMKITMRIEAVTAALGILVVTAPGQEVGGQLEFGIVPEKSTVRLGDPIMVSVQVTDQTLREARVYRSVTAFHCFEVRDPDGRVLPYVGFDGQIMSNPVEVPARSSITIGDVDLTEKYIFEKAGRYSVRFTGAGAGLPGSHSVTVDVSPGQLSQFDRLAVDLLPVCPKGWHLVKDARGEVRPFGLSRVDGFVLHLCHNHMHAEAVYLWFTRSEAKVDQNETPRVKVENLGRARGLYVYGAIDKNTPPLWPTAVEDISRALQVTKE